MFNFRENDYNSARNTEFLVRLIFPSSAKFGLLMTNDGVLKLWHNGEIVFGHLSGVMGAYKEND